MPFTSETADLKHFPGTTKEAAEAGFERSEMPVDDGSNNIGRLKGRFFPVAPSNPVEDSD